MVAEDASPVAALTDAAADVPEAPAAPGLTGLRRFPRPPR